MSLEKENKKETAGLNRENKSKNIGNIDKRTVEKRFVERKTAEKKEDKPAVEKPIRKSKFEGRENLLLGKN